MKKRSILLTICLSTLALASCGSKESKPTGTINTSVNVTPSITKDSIDKVIVGTTQAIEKAVAGEYNYDMLATGISEMPLVYQDNNGLYHDLLVTYKTEDSTTWTYTIKDGMKWSDGVVVTAEDILFTLDYQEKTSGTANFHDQTVNGKTTKAKYTGYTLSEDKKSISLTLASTNVRELSNNTSFRVVPKHILENNENPTDADLRVSCGPYVLDSFSTGSQSMTFKKNAYYPYETNVDTIVYQMYKNEDTMYTDMASGALDFTWAYSKGVASSYIDGLLEAGVNLIGVSGTGAPAVLAFNNKTGLFEDENLRKAVSYALNYDTFKSTFGSAYAKTPCGGFVPDSTVGYKETEELTLNLEKAREYMKASGYTKNASGKYEKGGVACSFSLTVNSENALHVRYAELIKNNLEDFGISVVLDSVSKVNYQAKTTNQKSNNNITMEAAIYTYTPAGMGMMGGLGSIYVDGTHAVQGGCQVYDKEFLTIVNNLKEAKTLDEYIGYAGQIQEYYQAHTPLISLYWDSVTYCYGTRYKNYTVDLSFGLNNIMTWSTITKA